MPIFSKVNQQNSMELNILGRLVLSLLALASAHAASIQEVYWQSKFPNAPMPVALRAFLPSGTSPEFISHPQTSTLSLFPSKQNSDTSDGGNVEQKGRGITNNAISLGIDIGGLGIDVGEDGVSVDFGHDDQGPFSFTYGRSEDQLQSKTTAAHFFLDKELRPGKRMELPFTKTGTRAKFLPRQVAKNIPFSLDKLSEILDKFSVKSNSTKAEIMKKTIEECEAPSLKGEKKYCATSLEAMIDYVISVLGKNVGVIATEVDKDNTQLQEFKIEGVRMVDADKIVTCHALNYMYPVFYCHEMQATRAYLVPLVGADGTKARAVAVCHMDTSKWNANHVAFQVVKVKPGTAPICHSLPEDHIVWVAN